jgi:hypothetical protein
MMPTLLFNPVAIVTHNEWRLPRVVFHLAHVALGLPISLLALAFHMPLAWSVVAAAAIAVLDKCVWLDWHRTSGRLFNPKPFAIGDPWDFVSDLGLTIVGALAPCTRWTPVAIYALSTFNGT